MMYGVGTGRCGTKSLAIEMDGLHEPKPSISMEALEYYNEKSVPNGLMEKLEERSKLDTPIISDNKQSLVIDLICKVDPRPSFIWLIRNPHDTIRSFMLRGRNEDSQRMVPHGGFIDLAWDDNLSRLCWYWNAKNELIRGYLSGKKFKIMFTDELKVKSHESLQLSKLSYEQNRIITERCGDLFDRYRSMR